MDVSNCRGCGRLFNVINSTRLCPQCIQKLEEKFQEVKRYLEENPNSSIDAVAQDNDVSVKQIRQWVREERLAFAEGSVVGIECEQCGKQILTGRFCDACKYKMVNNLRSAYVNPKETASKTDSHSRDRMRFL